MPSDPLLIFRTHALRRMFERNISRDEVVEVLQSGRCIAEYPDDQPYPSRLLSGLSGTRPLHMVIADVSVNDAERPATIIVTVYEPDSELWSDDFTIRRIP